MKLTGLFKRGAACLCTAAILMGGVSAFALSPALPDEPAPAELSVTNAVSEAQLRSALSKLTVTYDSEAEGWQIDSPYEEASMEKPPAVCTPTCSLPTMIPPCILVWA